MRILVVDDDAATCDFLKSALEAESFSVDTALDGQKGLYLARTNDYDLLILDNILPKKTGFEVCKDVRAIGKHVPILMLSVKSGAEDKTTFLDAGADDYLSKPYSYKELMARIRAIMRRGRQISGVIFEIGSIVLNLSTQEVMKNGKPVHLTRKEFALLELLARHRGSLVSRGMILEHVWDINGDPFSKTVEVHLANLRKKIESRKDKIIINVPGRGYKITV